jgi:hypothetical protein
LKKKIWLNAIWQVSHEYYKQQSSASSIMAQYPTLTIPGSELQQSGRCLPSIHHKSVKVGINIDVKLMCGAAHGG